MAKYTPKTKYELQELIKDNNIYLGDIDTSAITDMGKLFDRDKNDNKIARIDFSGIEYWNVSMVENMESMFSDCYTFNQPLNNWDVSKVESMHCMFNSCHTFNQPLNNWDVSSVEKMDSMFYGCYTFNQPLNNWDVSSVKEMDYMFYGCYTFNQPLNNWDVSRVESMHCMFDSCYAFNQPLNNWDVSSVEKMDSMFSNCRTFNQPLNNWDVSSVKNFNGMFYHAYSFNKPLDAWAIKVNKASQWSFMFYKAISFDKDLSSWDLSQARLNHIEDMFKDCPISEQNKPNFIKKTKKTPKVSSPNEIIVQNKKLVFKPKGLSVECKIPQKALKFLCYALSNKNIVAMWHNEKRFYDNGALKSIAFIDYLGQENGKKCQNIYEFSEARKLVSFFSIYGDECAKIEQIEYLRDTIQAKITLNKEDDFKKIIEFFKLLDKNDNALAMLYKNSNVTLKRLLRGNYSVFSGADQEEGGESNSCMRLEYDEFGVLKGFEVDLELQEVNPSTTCCMLNSDGVMLDMQLDCEVWSKSEIEDILITDIADDKAEVLMKEANKYALEKIFGKCSCNKRGDIKGFENKDFCLKEVFLRHAFDLIACADEKNYDELKDNIKNINGEFHLDGYRLVNELDSFDVCGAYITKMMRFEVPSKYLSHIEKIIIEKSNVYNDGETAIAKAILMF